MNEPKPNVALAMTPNAEWRERYQSRLRALYPDAPADALDSDNDPTMQGRMMGDSPELCAKNMAEELMAWSAPNDGPDQR